MHSIERGQILRRSYEDCTILVRFDDGEPLRFNAIGASDGSSDSIFIRNYQRFLSAMQKASRVRMAAEVYRQGTPVFEFDVRGFDVAKYEGKSVPIVPAGD